MGDFFMTIIEEKALPEPCQAAAEVCTLTEKRVASRWRDCSRVVRLFVLLSVLTQVTATDAMISRAESLRIGQKIWENECGGTTAGLTSWNAGENFASLGIGHFIWYPKGIRGPFEESFPELVAFASRRGNKLPAVVSTNIGTGCPWKSRAEFLSATNSPEMTELRNFLAKSIDLQADFLVQRLQQALPKMLAAAPAQNARRWKGNSRESPARLKGAMP